VQRVVLIDFPHSEMKSVGFVTRILRDEATGAELAAVYVPTDAQPDFGLPGSRADGQAHADRLDRRPGDDLHHLRRRGQPGAHPFSRATVP
jgi:hypothetical protein